MTAGLGPTVTTEGKDTDVTRTSAWRAMRRMTIALAVAVVAVTGLTVLPAQAAVDAVAPAASACPAGRPGLAVTVGWRQQDVNWLVMTPHVQVANCKGRIKAIRLRLESYNNGYLTQRATDLYGTYPSKYGNKNMMIHWPNYLPTVYEAGQSGRFVGIGFADVYPRSAPTNAAANQRPYELSTCSRRVDGLDIDTSGVTFKLFVWPVDAKHKVIPDVAGAVLGPFTCMQPNVSTAG
jgi:hypothetical protein